MVRIVFFLIFTALAVTAAVTLAGFPGLVRIEWLGRIVELPIGLGIAALLAIALLGAITFWIFRAIWRTPRAVGQALERRRSSKGYQAVSAGMLAVAAGDAQEAKRQARKAQDLLSGLPLTKLLSAQAAQLDGNEGAAKQYFEAMLDDRDTEFLGVRGLLTLSAKDGDRPTTLRLAKRAVALKPTSPWAQVTGFEAEVNSHLWLDAQTTLSRAVGGGTISKADGNKLKAAILTERSRVALGEDQPHEALTLATQARKIDPTSRSVALWLAKRQVEAGKIRAARNTVEKVWAAAPGGQLAALYAETGPDGEKPAKLLERMQRLARQNPDHVESLLAVAKAQISAGKTDAARDALLRVESVEPTRRVYRLLADLEREGGDPILVDGWLSKADRAAEDRPDLTYEAATAPERVWAAAPGWRGRELGVGEEGAPSPGTDVAIGYEGKVPKLPNPDKADRQPAANAAPPAQVTGDLTAQSEARQAPARATILPPADTTPNPVPEPAAEPVAEPVAKPTEPKQKTNGSVTNGAHHTSQAKPTQSIEASPKPAEVIPAPPTDDAQAAKGATPMAAATDGSSAETVNRDWLSRPNRSIGGALGKAPPQERSWLTKPSRSI